VTLFIPFFTAVQEYIPPVFTGLKYYLDCCFIRALGRESIFTSRVLAFTQKSQQKLKM